MFLQQALRHPVRPCFGHLAEDVDVKVQARISHRLTIAIRLDHHGRAKPDTGSPLEPGKASDNESFETMRWLGEPTSGSEASAPARLARD
jgi:hypothetical protein